MPAPIERSSNARRSETLRLSRGAAGPQIVCSRLRPFLLLLVLALAAAVRLSPLQGARDGKHWLFADGDSYYHLRRIEQTIERNGRVPMFDPDLSFPRGQRIQWHAGYDLLVAGAVAAACGSRPGRDCLETVAAFSTPLLGVMATLVVFLLGRAAAGPAQGLAAAVLFALYPFSAGGGAIGHVDHHVVEPLLVAAVLWALAGNRPLAGGVIAGASFAFFPSALLPFGVVTGALVLDRLWKLRRGVRRDLGPLGFTACALAVLVPVVRTGAFADTWEPAATSLFHLAAVGGAFLLLACLEAAAGLASARLRQALLGLAAVVCAAGLIAGSSTLFTLSRFGLGKASDLWTGVVQQQPLASGPVTVALLVMAVTCCCCWTIVDAYRRERNGLALAGMTALPLTLLGIWQIRFLMMASPPLALSIAHLLTGARALLLDGLASQPKRTRVLGRLTFAALVLLALVPAGEYLRPQLGGPSRLRDGARLLRRFGETRARVPEGSDVRPPVARAVLSDWTWGHHILYFTGLPTVASPFILSGRDRANVEARRALLAEQPEIVYRTMRERGSRYLLVSSFFDPAAVAASLGRDAPRSPAAVQLMADQVEGWSRLRLADLEPRARLYELVPGARLTGSAEPGKTVEAVLEVRLRKGESIRFRYQAVASAKGRFWLRVPQSTGASGNGRWVAAPYAIAGCRVPVAETQVREGQPLEITCNIR